MIVVAALVLPALKWATVASVEAVPPGKIDTCPASDG
jgi:hypothetical protein